MNILKTEFWSNAVKMKMNGLLACTIAMVSGLMASTALGQSASPLERLKYDVKYLASDELEGRGVETKGIEKAAQYIIAEYKKVGLKAGGKDGSYRQKFPVPLGRTLDSEKVMFSVKHGDESKKLELGKDFQAYIASGNSEVEDAKVAFVGYSITAERYNYDDFADIDVEGKVVVMISREPQVSLEKSAFDNDDEDGNQDTRYARLTTKLRTAKRNGAVGVILVRDRDTTDDGKKDELPQPAELGSFLPRSAKLPVVVIPRAQLDDFLSAQPLKTPTGGKLDSVLAIEKHIDDKMEPVSQAMDGVTVSMTIGVKTKTVDAYNIVGVIEGEGENKDEVIVIGAHYDHLGFGPYGSRRRQSNEVHNGADDNATGTAAVIELARRYKAYDKKPNRTIVFVCFSGEERGLVGARYWVNDQPLFPLDKTVTMINYDMIGWLRDKKLTIYNGGSSAQFGPLFEKANEDFGFKLDIRPGGGSDHRPFNERKIPNMFLHTGLTDLYHTPEDDYETLNMEGAHEVVNFSEKLIWLLANTDDTPKFGSAARPGQDEIPRPEVAQSGGYMGVQLNAQSSSVEVELVMPESAAAKSGIRKGDKIISVDGEKIEKPQELIGKLAKKKPGDTVEVEVQRGETKIKTKVKLTKRPETSDR